MSKIHLLEQAFAPAQPQAYVPASLLPSDNTSQWR